MFIRCTLTFLLAFMFCFTLSAKKLAPETTAFVEKVRTLRGSSYAQLNGTIQHRRSGKSAIAIPLYLGLIIQPERTTGQIILDNREGYLLGQGRSASASSVLPMQKSTELLDNVGVRASDLTLAFLFDEVIGEDENETVSGLVQCRVIRFRNLKSGEISRIYISKQHYFPLKAEFFRQGENKPWRTLEIDGFAEKNSLYYASRMRVEGPGWRSRIIFDESRCTMGIYDASKPVKVIKKLPPKQN
ncbi:MAG: hypothetical protein IKC77_06945 [Lentisphaeria bacterium]|nr:hypothetical protein [Lentisphaeria bacterium]